MRNLSTFALLLLTSTACQPGGIAPRSPYEPPPEVRIDAGPPVDGSVGGGVDADLDSWPDSGFVPRGDAGPDVGIDAGPTVPPEPPGPADCSGVSGAGHTLCGEADGTCEMVFYDGSGCAAACASAGLTCLSSFRDADDNPSAPQCAPHSSGESYGCADTGHMSDFCVCGQTGTPPPPPPPPGPAFDGLAFEGAEGFGAQSEGGYGGTVYTVTNLDDSGTGSLRWAVERSGRRIVQFDVHGVIRLRSALDIDDPYLTIDGRGALDPGEEGITIRDYPIDIRTHDVILRYFRVRLGDWAVLRRNDLANRSRPSGSGDLDCINIHQSRDIILDHMSLSWSADEIVSVTNSRDITIQWSILSEPLGDRALHPYGDDHAFASNNSAATITYHHNLFAHYRFRGPQFEANDMQNSSPRFDANFEAVNNVIYGYTSSGSRYRSGFERGSDRVTSVDFSYHFVANRYLESGGSHSEIQVDTQYGEEDNIHVYLSGNIGPHRSSNSADERDVVFTDTRADDRLRDDSRARAQVSDTPLFAPPVPVTVESANAARDSVLADAGCSIERDATDTRVVRDAREVRAARTLSSQDEVPEGWPTY